MSDNMNNRDGWVPISCRHSDDIRAVNAGVSSSLTDPEGNYGPGVIYTEWIVDGVPALRDYLWSADGRLCEHLVPGASS